MKRPIYKNAGRTKDDRKNVLVDEASLSPVSSQHLSKKLLASLTSHFCFQQTSFRCHAYCPFKALSDFAHHYNDLKINT